MWNDKSSKLKKYRVDANDEIAPGVFLLKYQRDFSFVAGQVIALAMQPGDTPRMYSIASGIRDAEVWILYDLRPQGQLTPNLSQLKIGDKIFASQPSGNFYGSALPAVWIASGTGIAPFVSMWRSGLNKDKTLIHGGRFLHSFYFKTLFQSALGSNYIRCCSRDSGEGVYHGRLTQWLEENPALAADRKYYLCGSAEMVVDARDTLIGKNIPYDNILAEIYF